MPSMLQVFGSNLTLLTFFFFFGFTFVFFFTFFQAYILRLRVSVRNMIALGSGYLRVSLA